MAQVTKTIPLSDFEKEHIAGTGANLLKCLLIPLMRWTFLNNMDTYRFPANDHSAIVQKTEREILYKKLEIAGTPKPVGIGVFSRKSLNKDTKPLFFYIHGGGFVGGSSRVNEGMLRYLVDRFDLIAATVDYNLAPQLRFPGALNECQKALQHIIENYTIDNSLIFIAGDSAGGNLTAALTLKMMDEGISIPKGQIMLYPILDFNKLDRESYFDKGLEFTVMRREAYLARDMYLPDIASRKSKYASPLLTDFFTPQPDALLLIAEHDVLREDGLDYGRKLDEAGGYARTVLYKGAGHAFIKDLFRSDIANDALDEIVRFISERVGKSL